MKVLKKVGYISLIMFIILSLFSNVFAMDLKTQLNVIQKSSETKYLENNQGYISKTIVDSNKDTGEVTIELKLSNTKKETEQTEKYEDTEVYLLVDENIVKDADKLPKYLKDVESLTKKIFESNSKTKVGIIGIKGTICDLWNEGGKTFEGDKHEGNVPGSDSNAEVVVKLTNNIDSIKNGIKNMNASKNRYYTNLQAAIRLANNSYSKNVNKILISLFDNVPDIAIGVKSQVSGYGSTKERVIALHEKIATYTKNEILTLKKSNVSFILLRPDDTSYDETWYSLTTGEKLLDFDGSPYVKKLYGTVDNPTYGKMYNFNDSNIETIITENIYQDVKKLIQPDISNTKVVDYFPTDIINNFDFAYVGKPNIGTVSDNIDENTNTITWDIGKLEGTNTATLKYKLKIKDMKNEELLNKTIATNEKVVLTYKDSEAKDYTVTLSSSPKIQLSEVKEELTATVSYDPTTKTTGTVKATIKTNKKVNEVDGWALAKDGKTLTKTYSKNTTETVHLVDKDNITKDVIVKISNITKPTSNENKKDETILTSGILPQTGICYGVLSALILFVAIGIFTYIKNIKYKDIK